MRDEGEEEEEEEEEEDGVESSVAAAASTWGGGGGGGHRVCVCGGELHTKWRTQVFKFYRRGSANVSCVLRIVSIR